MGCALAWVFGCPRQTQCLGSTEVHTGPDLPVSFVVDTLEDGLLGTQGLVTGLTRGTLVLGLFGGLNWGLLGLCK